EELLHAGVCTANGQSDPGAKGEACQAEWQLGEVSCERLQRRAHVLGLAPPLIEVTSAATHAAKVEAQHRYVQLAQRLRDAEDDLVVQSAAVDGVRVADDSGHARRLSPLRQAQQPFEHAMRRGNIYCLQLGHRRRSL